MFGVRFRVRDRFRVRISVRVIVRVNSFRDYFSVLLRAQHRPPTSDHKSSRALTAHRLLQKIPVKYELQQHWLGHFLSSAPAFRCCRQGSRWHIYSPHVWIDSPCIHLSVSSPYKIVVCSVHKHINTTRMHTITLWQFILYSFKVLWEKKNPYNIQPTLPFH